MPDDHSLMPLLQRSTAWLAERGVTNARRECEWLFAHRLGLSRLELYTRFDMPLSGPALDGLRDDLRRRGRREPLAYILGTQPFRGLELAVTPAVLVPRPETEDLVEKVLEELTGLDSPRVVDVGTGSGAIAIAIKHARPDARVTAGDVSREALAVARGNAESLGLEIEWVTADLLTGLPGPWDLVVANLPYVAPEERGLCDPEIAFEPAVALFADGGGMGLIEGLLDQLGGSLTADGVAWLEIGGGQAARVATACRSRGLACEIHRDTAGHERMARIGLPA